MPQLIKNLLLILLLTGCQSSTDKPPTKAPPLVATNPQYIKQTAKVLYLIGSFNLWQHKNEYQLINVAENTYAASAELSGGQSYEFMFAAKDPTQPYSNCGHSNKQQLQLNQRVKASCTNVVLQNFVFTPKQSATYEFFIQLNSLNHPMVYIKKAY